MFLSTTFAMTCIQLLRIIVLSSCIAGSYANTLKPFTTDGCSMFPDSAGPLDWTHCCVTHDLAYWRGGTAEQRRMADQQLAQCVRQQTQNSQLAQAMYQGVRLGGSPYSLAPYRWGYGWESARFYQPLTVDELALAAFLEAQYWQLKTHVTTK